MELEVVCLVAGGRAAPLCVCVYVCTVRVARHCMGCPERWGWSLQTAQGSGWALSTDGAVGVPVHCRGWHPGGQTVL